MNETLMPYQSRWPVQASAAPVAGLARKILFRLLSTLENGQVCVYDGDIRRCFGHAALDVPLAAEVRIRDRRAYTAIVFGGSIGAAEAYMQHDWESDDLTALVRIVLRNQVVFRELENGLARLATPFYQLFHRLRRNTVSGSRKNIVAHYDLGNDFYRLFLDETLTYSAGYFETPDATLAQASIAKYDRICRKLHLSEKDHVLEIGTGWGGFALHAVQHYGCRVTTTTISDAQHTLARERIAAAGVADRITLLKSDYRALRGQYDKLVSIEMIEAVGHHYLETFMAQCARLLKPEGSMALQAITIADWAFESHKRSVDFIKRYIFPGSCIPSVAAIGNAAARRTDLRLFDLEDMTPHYAETLRRWRDNFHRNADPVRALGFSDAFMRMWTYYLHYCEAGFEERYLGSVQMIFTKPLARMPVVGRTAGERS